MNKSQKKQHKRLHLLTRLVIGMLIALSVLSDNDYALMVLTFAWLFEPELVRFERKAITLIKSRG